MRNKEHEERCKVQGARCKRMGGAGEGEKSEGRGTRKEGQNTKDGGRETRSKEKEREREGHTRDVLWTWARVVGSHHSESYGEVTSSPTPERRLALDTDPEEEEEERPSSPVMFNSSFVSHDRGCDEPSSS